MRVSERACRGQTCSCVKLFLLMVEESLYTSFVVAAHLFKSPADNLNLLRKDFLCERTLFGNHNENLSSPILVSRIEIHKVMLTYCSNISVFGIKRTLRLLILITITKCGIHISFKSDRSVLVRDLVSDLADHRLSNSTRVQ